MAKINQKNSRGQRHGFWNQPFELWNRDNMNRHYINGIRVGYYEGNSFKSYYKNGKIFGVELYYSIQCFYKQAKLFGEKLEWQK